MDETTVTINDSTIMHKEFVPAIVDQVTEDPSERKVLKEYGNRYCKDMDIEDWVKPMEVFDFEQVLRVFLAGYHSARTGFVQLT